jgi:hypothetical protein
MQGHLIPVFATAQIDCKSEAHIFYVSNIEALTDGLSSECDMKNVIIHDFQIVQSERQRGGVWRDLTQSDPICAIGDQIESNDRRQVPHATPSMSFWKNCERQRLRNSERLIPSRPLFGGKL